MMLSPDPTGEDLTPKAGRKAAGTHIRIRVCLKYTYMPGWLILHERIVDDLCFPYCFYIIILNF